MMEEVQILFSRIYESDYPLSIRVQNGLFRVLNNKYNGSEKMFKDEFVHRTIKLVETLRQKNFPLWVKTSNQHNPDDQMIVLHLVPPQEKDMESGEFCFQVGHTRPGKLAIKFAKYQHNGTVKTQPSTVEEDDYDCVFSDAFFSHLRKMNRLGDSMFRTLIVLQVKNDETRKLQAKDYLRVCPEERRGRFRTGSHLSIEESGEEDECKPKLVHMASENDE